MAIGTVEHRIGGSGRKHEVNISKRRRQGGKECGV